MKHHHEIQCQKLKGLWEVPPSFFSVSMVTPRSVHTCSAVAIATERCDEVGLPAKMKSST